MLVASQYYEYELFECSCDEEKMMCYNSLDGVETGVPVLVGTNRYANRYVNTDVRCYEYMPPRLCWFYRGQLHSLSFWNFEGLMYVASYISSVVFSAVALTICLRVV